MANPIWVKTLSQVLMQKTEPKFLISEKTGNEYSTEVVPLLSVTSTGSVEEVNEKFKYSIVDVNNNLEYSIKVPNKINVKFGTRLTFVNVRGGATSNGSGWFSADSVSLAKLDEKV